jgi:hypothetical protein
MTTVCASMALTCIPAIRNLLGALPWRDVVVGVALVAVLGAAGCASDPATFPTRLERALASGQVEQVERLLSRESRPLFRAMTATSARRDGPFALLTPKQTVRTLGIQRGESGVLLSVQVGSEVRDWVLVDEGGDYRLDLMATSARRPWGAQTY